MTELERRDPDLEERFRAAYARAQAFSAALTGPSLAEQLVELGVEDPAAFEAILASIPTLDLARLCYAWDFWARPKQRPRGLPRHRIIAAIAARGLGKSRLMAERVRERIEAGSRAGALVAPTIEDVERYQLGGRESDASKSNGGHGLVESSQRVGLLDVFPPHQRPEYKASAGEVHFHTGAVYYLVSGKKPEYRGGNLDTVWIEEATNIPRVARETLTRNAILSLRRLGDVEPELLISCTPTPDPWIRAIVADPTAVIILGEIEENSANLTEGLAADLRARYGKSRLARQELGGEILGDVEGALFSPIDIAGARVRGLPPKYKRIVVAVDPAISTGKGTDDTAIVAAARGEDDAMYVLAHRAGRWSPQQWAGLLLDMRRDAGASEVVAERNRGGDLVKSVVTLVAEARAAAEKTVAAVKVREVIATEGKSARAEELQVLSERGQLRFPADPLVELEDQITTWDPRLGGSSPNGLDALVWAAFALYDGFAHGLPDPRPAFKGLEAAQEALPEPAFAAPVPRRRRDEHDERDWDRV